MRIEDGETLFKLGAKEKIKELGESDDRSTIEEVVKVSVKY